MIKQAIIFCGGYGTRLLPLTKKIPKPMVMINKKPFLLYLVEQCKLNGIKNFVFLCGYKSEIIKKFFGDGKKFGVKITYHYNPPSVETYKRICDAKKNLQNNFLLLYADNYSSLNLHDLKKNYINLKSKFIISICKKKEGNISINSQNNKIKKYFFKKNAMSKYVDIGYMLLNKKFLFQNYQNKNLSFSNFINNEVNKKKVNFFYNDTGYLSISDPKRLKITKKYFETKAILIDRDGVLNIKNKNHFYVRTLNELKLNYTLIKKYKKILKNNLLLCISNQAGISTGEVTNINLKKINKKIKQELIDTFGIKIKEFFISPHHFNSNNFDRKPNQGLFLKAAQKYNIILDRTFYIGDDIRDIEASYRSKTKCLYVGSDKISDKLQKKYINTLI